jgi:hypothetical protein
LIALAAFVLARGSTFGHPPGPPPPPPVLRLEGDAFSYAIEADATIVARARDGSTSFRATLRWADDEGVRPLKVVATSAAEGLVQPGDASAAPPSANLEVASADGAVELAVGVTIEHDRVLLTPAHSSADGGAPGALGLSFPLLKRSVFLEGRGELADLASAERGPAVYVEGEGGPAAVAVAEGELAVDVEAKDGLQVAAFAPPEQMLAVTFGKDAAAVRGGVDWLRHRSTKLVRGRVTGATGAVHVVGLDEAGAPRVRIPCEPDGTFAIAVPEEVSEWYASEGTMRASAPIHFAPGTPWDLTLDVSDGGELDVTIEDGDTHAPLTARLVVHGVEGTLDPTFGPDYRASGAGPLMDALRGEVATPVPAGKYRVLATKGIAWTIDSVVVDVKPGARVPVHLAPRHAIPSANWVGCDLHVHARPSFDSPVATEDRVLSLVAAGVDFAVPSEHNIVGDYAPSIDALGIGDELATVNGVEITTYSPRFGHFGLFPYPPKSAVPPYRATAPDKLFAAARANDPEKKRILQVNHPRLPKEIGYFNVQGYKHGGPIPVGMRKDFDALEVYNGYDIAVPARVDEVLEDWFALLAAGQRYVATGSSDSHRIQYQWAGYPRTVVRASSARPIDPLAVVAELKAGHAFVTSGPFIDATIDGHGPGETVAAANAKAVHVVVRAVPWIDVTSLELVVNGKVTTTLPIANPIPTEAEGRTARDPLPTLEASTIRLEQDVPLVLPPASKVPTWVVVVVRGTRLLDDVLPFMPVPPRAFTNPIWIQR